MISNPIGKVQGSRFQNSVSFENSEWMKVQKSSRKLKKLSKIQFSIPSAVLQFPFLFSNLEDNLSVADALALIIPQHPEVILIDHVLAALLDREIFHPQNLLPINHILTVLLAFGLGTFTPETVQSHLMTRGLLNAGLPCARIVPHALRLNPVRNEDLLEAQLHVVHSNILYTAQERAIVESLLTETGLAVGLHTADVETVVQVEVSFHRGTRRESHHLAIYGELGVGSGHLAGDVVPVAVVDDPFWLKQKWPVSYNNTKSQWKKKLWCMVFCWWQRNCEFAIVEKSVVGTVFIPFFILTKLLQYIQMNAQFDSLSSLAHENTTRSGLESINTQIHGNFWPQLQVFCCPVPKKF